MADTCRDIVRQYGKIVHATYSDSLSEAERLEKALQAFVADPTEETLAAAKTEWVDARHPYLQSEAFRFYAGPIDDEDGPEPMINGWPMDEFYIDYVEGSSESGIINETSVFPEITKELIATMNEKAGETAITSGFHAIEFLLWGQDHNDDGPGDRPVSDYVDGPNAERRGTYLLACADLLTDHLEGLVAEWAPDQPGNFRAEFEAKPPVAAAREILYGIHTLSGKELAGERLLVAWDTQAQEDEHSCFSDMTHLDVQCDAQGIANVYRGSYRKLDGGNVTGPGIRALVRTLLPDRLEEFDGKVAEMLRNVKVIPAPFDQAILGDDESLGRQSIFSAVISLEDFAAMLSELDRELVRRPGP